MKQELVFVGAEQLLEVFPRAGIWWKAENLVVREIREACDFIGIR